MRGGEGGVKMKRHGGISSNDLTPLRKKYLKEENTVRIG
jgi:hypothetical protein